MEIWPRPGVHGDALLRALQYVANTAQNVFNGGGGTQEAIGLYLKWADSAAEQLAPVATAEDIDRLVLTQTYWATYQNSDVSQARLAKVRREVQGRVGVLDETVRDVQSLLLQWRRRSREERLMVLDTNVLLQHEADVRSMPWHDLLEEQHASLLNLRVILPMVVVDELDNAKRTNARTRARTTTRQLWEWPGSQPERSHPLVEQRRDGGGGVSVEVLLDPPGHVRLPLADDEIVSRAAAVGHVRGEAIDFVTFDAGAAFRAGAAGLITHQLIEPELSVERRGRQS